MEELTIQKVDNGFVINIPKCWDMDGNVSRVTLVFEAENDEYGMVDAMVNALWEIVEYFGLMGGRYDRKRITIGTKPGDKYEKPVGETDD